MSWASHPTTEMPTDHIPPTGRHRVRRRGLIGAFAAGGVLLLLGVSAYLAGLFDPSPSPPKAAWADSAPQSLAGGPGTDGATAPPATPIPPGSVSVAASAALEAEVVTLTNAERAKQGCPELRVDDGLAAAARAHSVEMAGTGTFQHDSLDGTDPGERMRAAGYDTSGTGWAENIARGQADPAAVLTAWLASPGHRANILNCGHRAIGVGAARAANGQLYWTQDFGGR
jgi:uncharacterized protein YkwD